MSYFNETSGSNGTSGWGVGLSAIIGGALGYWAGRSSYPGGGFGPVGYASCGCNNGCSNNGGCTTCYQQGIQAGQTLAGIDYTAQMSAANANNLRNYVSQLSNAMQNGFAAMNSRFQSLNQQKIQDQAAQIAALRTQNVVGMNAAVMNAQLTSLNDKISSIISGCSVRSMPACPSSNCGCSGI